MRNLEGTAADYYYGHDHLYSPVVLFENDGDVVERYEYDAYGTARIMDASYGARSTSSYSNPYLFTGRRLDTLDGGDLNIKESHHLSGLAGLKGLDMRVFCALAVLVLFFVTFEYCSAETLQESNRLVEAYLNAVNLNVGIEYFGGPFSIDQYDVEVEKSECAYSVSYSYKKPFGIEGWPDSLDVEISSILGYPFSKKNADNVENTDVFVSTGFSKEEIEEILIALPTFVKLWDKRDGYISLVTVDSKGDIKRDTKTYTRIHSIYRPAPDLVQVLFCPDYKSFYFGSTLGASRLDFILNHNSWKILLPIKSHKKSNLSLEQRFVLYGQTSQENLKNLIDKIGRIPGIPGIKAIKINGDIATVYEGAPDVINDPIFKSAIVSVTLKKTSGGWEVLRTAEITNAEQHKLFGFIALPLLPESHTKTSLSKLRASLFRPGIISDKDLTRINDFITRIPNVRYSTGIISLWEEDNVSVDLNTEYSSTSLSTPVLLFKRTNGSWIISKTTKADIQVRPILQIIH